MPGSSVEDRAASLPSWMLVSTQSCTSTTSCQPVDRACKNISGGKSKFHGWRLVRKCFLLDNLQISDEDADGTICAGVSPLCPDSLFRLQLSKSGRKGIFPHSLDIIVSNWLSKFPGNDYQHGHILYPLRELLFLRLHHKEEGQQKVDNSETARRLRRNGNVKVWTKIYVCVNYTLKAINVIFSARVN